jgi:hypothetical protein
MRVSIMISQRPRHLRAGNVHLLSHRPGRRLLTLGMSRPRLRFPKAVCETTSLLSEGLLSRLSIPPSNQFHHQLARTRNPGSSQLLDLVH